jgi:hypothetical protein
LIWLWWKGTGPMASVAQTKQAAMSVDIESVKK